MAAAALISLGGALGGQTAFAQSAAPGSGVIQDDAVTLDAITIEASPEAEAAEEGVAEAAARRRLEALPGGTALIGRQELEGSADVTAADSLSRVPGVIVQSFFGGNDQPRIQIRGSGLQQSPVERGILMLQDGLPLNRADGSYVVGLADPRQAAFTEIYRGNSASRLGATVLGGAINFVSPNGSTAPGVEASAEGGSFGQITSSLRAGGSAGPLDGNIQASYSQREGFRDYNKSDRLNVNLNAGAELGESLATRLFLGHTRLKFDVAGPLTWEALEDDRRQAFAGPTVGLPGPTVVNPGPNVIRDRPKRDTEQSRIGSRSSAVFGPHLIDFGAGFSHTDDEFRFPIGSGIRSTEGGDFSGVLRYAFSPDEARPLPLLELTAKYDIGSADRENYQNIAGQRGALFGDSDLDATTLSLQASGHVPLWESFTFSPSLAFSHATRDNDDRFGPGARPVAGFNPVTGLPQAAFALGQDTSYSHSFDGWSGSLALSYEVMPESMLFGAVSRSFEPPTHDDLLAPINGTPFFGPGAPLAGVPQFAFGTPDLDAQTATTLEAGWRGQWDRFTWDAVGYYSWVENELLSLRDSAGTQLPSANADRTTHLGLEIGLGASITEALSARVAYTYQDFRFDDDPLHGDNRLAGAPRHSINGALRYSFTPSFFVEMEIDWRPDETPVDNANSLYSDSWVTVDLRSAYGITDNVSLYGEVRNLFDETYASSTLVTDTARADQAAFLPGDGRAFLLGMRLAW